MYSPPSCQYNRVEALAHAVITLPAGGERMSCDMVDDWLPFLTQRAGKTLLAVYVQPGAGKNAMAGIFQDRLKIRISAPPVEGQANRECILFLSRLLGVAKTEIILAHGEQSRRKTFMIARPGEFIIRKLEEAGLACRK